MKNLIDAHAVRQSSAITLILLMLYFVYLKLAGINLPVTTEPSDAIFILSLGIDVLMIYAMSSALFLLKSELRYGNIPILAIYAYGAFEAHFFAFSLVLAAGMILLNLCLASIEYRSAKE